MNNKLEKFEAEKISVDQASKIIGGQDHLSTAGIPPDNLLRTNHK